MTTQTRYKKVYATVWINSCKWDVWEFEDLTLKEAAKKAMNSFRYFHLYRLGECDDKVLTSKHPIARHIRQILGIPFGKRDLKKDPGRNTSNNTAMMYAIQRMLLELPPIDHLIEKKIITDPALYLGETMRAVVRVSNKYRFSATKTALK